MKLAESARIKSRLERKFQDATEESEAQQRNDRKQIAELEEQLREAREAVFRAQRNKST